MSASKNDLTPLSLTFLIYKMYVTFRVIVKMASVVIFWSPFSPMNLNPFPRTQSRSQSLSANTLLKPQGCKSESKREWDRKGGKADTDDVLSSWPWLLKNTLLVAYPRRAFPERHSWVTETENSFVVCLFVFHEQTAVYQVDSSRILLLIDYICPLRHELPCTSGRWGTVPLGSPWRSPG